MKIPHLKRKSCIFVWKIPHLSENHAFCMLFSQESTPSQMLLYGKYMLFNDQIFDFEGKLDAINAVSEEDVREAIALTFDESQKAVGAVGNTDKPFAL